MMNVQELVDKYFEQIEIEDTNFVMVNDAVSDAAYLLLNLPIEMLREYQQLNGQRKKLPDGAEFWKKTELAERLRNSNKYCGQGHAPLADILEFLMGDVQADYQRLHSTKRIRLSVYESLELTPNQNLSLSEPCQ